MTTEPVLIDTGPIVAIHSPRDEFHETCLDELQKLRPPLLTCWPVVTEAAWLLRKDPTAVSALYDSFRIGVYQLLTLVEADLPGIEGVLKKYPKLRLQLADAAIVHLAERENSRTVFTLDQRDFSIIRVRRNQPLRLIPEVLKK